MPWCPKCKAEYQSGITMCSDCKVELVEDLKEGEILVPFFQSDDKKVAEKLIKFLQYSDLNSSLDYDEENEIYIVSVPPKKQMEAKKLYQAFYFVERERMEKGESDVFTAKPKEEASDNTDQEKASDDTEQEETSDTGEDTSDEANDDQDITLAIDETSMEEKDNLNETPGDDVSTFEEDEEDENNSSYVMKADQYKDLSGTVWIFLFFGLAGIIFIILNVLGVLSILNGWVPNIVMGALFLFFIYIALSTNQKAKKIQTEIEAENKLTVEINAWLEKNVTESYLTSISDENVSKELNYITQTDAIKELLIKEFGNQNLSYLDRLIEEYYIKTFDNAEE